jgi:predicted ATPase
MLMRGHSAMGASLVFTGNFAESLLHYDQVLALYDPVEHRPMAMRFVYDLRAGALNFGALAVWALGYPEAALARTEQALREAREIGHAGGLMAMMFLTCLIELMGRNYTAAQAQSVELIALAEEKGSIFWKAAGMLARGWLLGSTGKTLDAVGIFTSAIPAWRSMGATIYLPACLTHLGKACAELGQFDEAWSYIDDAITTVKTTKQTWYEADVHRTAGKVALMSPEHNAAKAEACFKRALEIAHAQQAKSFELRAAMSMARLWRSQGRRDEARELLAPVYGWFTEGFDTLDLKQARALLDELT